MQILLWNKWRKEGKKEGWALRNSVWTMESIHVPQQWLGACGALWRLPPGSTQDHSYDSVPRFQPLLGPQLLKGKCFLRLLRIPGKRIKHRGLIWNVNEEMYWSKAGKMSVKFKTSEAKLYVLEKGVCDLQMALACGYCSLSCAVFSCAANGQRGDVLKNSL